jgi:hypothetical protein
MRLAAKYVSKLKLIYLLTKPSWRWPSVIFQPLPRKALPQLIVIVSTGAAP